LRLCTSTIGIPYHNTHSAPKTPRHDALVTTDICTTDAFAIIVVWPLFLVALVVLWVVNLVGSLGGGR
jgi:hypothetical protein